MPFVAGELLSRHTTFAIGGPAEWLVSPRTPGEAADVVRRCAQDGIPWRVLGGGANVLVPDSGVRGVTLSMKSLREVAFNGTTFTAGSGANFPHVVLEACKRGRAGFEGLSGIPGTVGGAISMNAGGRFGEIGVLVEHVDVVTHDGRVERRVPRFKYRGTDLNGDVILEAKFRTVEADPKALLARYREVIDEKNRTQPMKSRCAGCMFRNPPGASAGRMIDESGLKGRREGGAVVSPVHANFIVNEGGARAADVRRLADSVRDTVARERGVNLQFEVVIW